MGNSIKPGKDQKPTIFEFDGKGQSVQEISMTDLNRSIRRESGLAGIRAIPIQYWRMFEAITSMLQASDLNFTENDIWVQNNSSKAYLTDEDKNEGFTQKNAPINRWRFDKIISTIQLPGITEGQDEGTLYARNAAIGLTLNREGLSVAFGMNVHACTNFNVMGGSLLQSYGHNRKEGLPWDVMEIRLNTWISNLTQIWSVQNEIMREMKELQLPEDTGVIEGLIGNLYLGALKQAYFKGDAVPFNTHELSEFVQESIKQQKENEMLETVWDVYNWGTSIMKPGRMDIGEIATNSNMWSEYLVKEFALDVPALEFVATTED